MIVKALSLLDLLFLDLTSDLLGLFLFDLLKGEHDCLLDIIVIVNKIINLLNSGRSKLLSGTDLFIKMIWSIFLGVSHFMIKNLSFKLNFARFHVDSLDVAIWNIFEMFLVFEHLSIIILLLQHLGSQQLGFNLLWSGLTFVFNVLEES